MAEKELALIHLSTGRVVSNQYAHFVNCVGMLIRSKRSVVITGVVRMAVTVERGQENSMCSFLISRDCLRRLETI